MKHLQEPPPFAREMSGVPFATLALSVLVCNSVSANISRSARNNALLEGCASVQHGPRTISVPLVNHKNLHYTAALKIGTPGQAFNVLLDPTGTTWVPAYFCAKIEPCFGHNMFDWTESTSYTTDWEETTTDFNRGNISGYQSLDKQELGGSDIGKHFFVNAIGFHGVSSYVNDPFDGVFGLRIEPHSPLKEMTHAGLIAKPWVGLYFSADEGTLGEAFFGGANHDYYHGELNFVHSEGTGFYFPIKKITVACREHVLEEDITSTRVSPTEPYIGGPSHVIRSINDDLNGTRTDDGKYELGCHVVNLLPDVAFNIASADFILRPTDYVMKVDTPAGTKCYSAFVEAEQYAGAVWHLGLAFLRRVYTVLEAPLDSSNHGRIGFAEAR
ncbi:lysosomal aspartic protease-like [Haemaphysalis longicornis]